MMNQISDDPSNLSAGDHHYKAYVGPPGQYDFMGATQFRLLCTLGLRARHDLLDCGCGSLRAGRLFINYLEPGHYCGIEPNQWLIEESIRNEVGDDLIRIKKPRFDHNSDFAAGIFGQQFDFIIAQSIFSHTGEDLLTPALRNFKAALKPRGLIAATFVEGLRNFSGEGWVYPDCVTFRPARIRKLAREAGLAAVRIPWYHPRQTWYLLAHDKSRLPSCLMMKNLTGSVLFDPEFSESYKWTGKITHFAKHYAREILPKSAVTALKAWKDRRK